MKTVTTDHAARDKMLVTYVESLESPKPEIRQGACVALGLLKVIFLLRNSVLVMLERCGCCNVS